MLIYATPLSTCNNLCIWMPSCIFAESIGKEDVNSGRMDHKKIEREKNTVSRMIELYCRHKLGLKEITAEYRELENYAHRRLDRCKFGSRKPACKRCPIHCYKPAMREKIREIMRWAGPRMLLYDPIAAIRHLIGR